MRHSGRRYGLAAGMALLAGAAARGGEATDWPMVQFDAARRGASPDQPEPHPRGGYKLIWRRDFYAAGALSDDYLQSRVRKQRDRDIHRAMVNDWPGKDPELIINSAQPICVGGVLYVGTGKNRVYALDVATGGIVWRHQCRPRSGGFFCGGAFAEGKVIFASSDGSVYALDAEGDRQRRTTSVVWEFRPADGIGGFLTAPAVAGGKVFVGSDDGVMYALNVADGKPVWAFGASARIRNSPAVDTQAARVYFGAEDLTVHALDAATGRAIWKNRLTGTLMEFFPVISRDGSTVFWRTSPSGEGHEALHDADVAIARAAGVDPGADRKLTGKDPGATGRARPTPAGIARENAAIAAMLRADPGLETFHALDAATGKKRYLVPIAWCGGEGQAGMPPVIARDGTVIARIRTYYSAYDSPGLGTAWPLAGLGTIDLDTGGVRPLNPDGGHMNVSISDEVYAASIGGRRLFLASHNDTLNTLALDPPRTAAALLTTRDGVYYTYSRNVPFLGETGRRFLRNSFDERGVPSMGPVVYGRYVLWVAGGVVGCFGGVEEGGRP